MSGSDSTVQCSGSLSSMEFPNVQFIKISALNFTNCGRADFNNVNSLIVENCNIFSQQESWSLETVSNATIVRSWFLNGQVGPVLLVARSSLLIKHSMLVNTTTGSGSYCEGAAVNCEFAVLNIEQSVFLQNMVDCVFFGDGGAIYAFTTDVSITDSTFSENSALYSGGAVCINGGSLKISNSSFGYNSADRGTGGALHVYAIFNSVFIYDCRFLNNSANFNLEGSGGAVYIESRSSNISFTGVSFNKNSAASCGALRVMNFNNYHNVSIISSNFTYNTETQRRMTEEFTIVTTYTHSVVLHVSMVLLSPLSAAISLKTKQLEMLVCFTLKTALYLSKDLLSLGIEHNITVE